MSEFNNLQLQEINLLLHDIDSIKEMDGNYVNLKIIEETNEELQKLTEDLLILKEIMTEMSKHVVVQGEIIETIEENVNKSDVIIEETVENLENIKKTVRRLRNKKILVITAAVSGAIVGGAVLGGVGLLFGPVSGAISGGVGAGAGAVIGGTLVGIFKS